MRKVACIDLEGVVIPELWPFLAQQTGHAAFWETTRETPDYAVLMQKRIAALREAGLRLSDVQACLASVAPLPGALTFLQTLATNGYEIQMVSDCFVELAAPLLRQLGNPREHCHRLVIDEQGYVIDCAFTGRRDKVDVVMPYLHEGATVLAVGDAFNDLAMLRAATHGFLLRPSPQTRTVAPDIRTVERLEDIIEAMFGRVGVSVGSDCLIG